MSDELPKWTVVYHPRSGDHWRGFALAFYDNEDEADKSVAYLTKCKADPHKRAFDEQGIEGKIVHSRMNGELVLVKHDPMSVREE